MTTPQMDWLDDQRRKRAVSSDDIVRRMELMDVPPGSYDEETLYDAVAEIKRLREIAEAAEQYHDVACDPDWCRLCRALNAPKEARRG